MMDNQSIDFIVRFTIAVAESLLALLALLLITNTKHYIRQNKVKVGLYLILNSVFVFWASLYLPRGVHTIVIMLGMILLLTYFTKINIYISGISALLQSIIVMVVDLGILALISSFTKMDLYASLNNIFIYVLSGIVCKVVDYIVVLLLFGGSKKFIKVDLVNKENYYLSYVIVETFMMIVSLLSVMYVVTHPINYTVYFIILTTIYLLCVTIGFMDYKERERVLMIRNKVEVQQQYINDMESVINIIRREKHDFSNHLNTILALCSLRKPDTVDRIEKYIAKLTHQNKHSYRFFETGNDYVDGLLAVKSSLAFENNIHMEVNIEEPLHKVRINDSHLTSIIGNLVDNAFEAILSQGDTEGKVVSVSTYMEDDYYYISVSDNGPPIPTEYMHKIFENGFSTKVSQKNEHGYGLHIVKQLVSKNNGEISVSSSEHETEFLIKLKIDELQHSQNTDKYSQYDTKSQSQSFSIGE